MRVSSPHSLLPAANRLPESRQKRLSVTKEVRNIGRRAQDFSRDGFQQWPAGAYRKNGQREYSRDQGFQAGHEPPGIPAAPNKPAKRTRANGRPKQPAREHDAERNLVAVKDHDQFAHQNDLRDNGSKTNKGKDALQLRRDSALSSVPNIECELVAHERCATAILPPKPPSAQRGIR